MCEVKPVYIFFSVCPSKTVNQWIPEWYVTGVCSRELEVNSAPFWNGMRRAWWGALLGNLIRVEPHAVCVCVCAVSQPSECEQCTCDSDGIARCLVADCAPPPCVNPVYQPGKCCPECKDGELNIAKKWGQQEVCLLCCMSITVAIMCLIICMQRGVCMHITLHSMCLPGCSIRQLHLHLPLLLISLQVLTATLMRHAARWFPLESPPGSTPAPSAVVMMARTPATGRETVSPPVPASKTARLNSRPPRKTDSLRQQRNSCYSNIQSLMTYCLFIFHLEEHAEPPVHVNGRARHQG